MKIVRIVSIYALLTLMLSCNNTSSQNLMKNNSNNQEILTMSKRIKISELKNTLLQLQGGHTEYNFIGITSNGIDCIYFVYENGKFNLEFEAMIEEQKPFIDKIKEYAALNSYKFLMTTYNNRPEYKSTSPAPVVRLETNSTIDQINQMGIDIQSKVFKNSTETVYEIVP